MDRTDENLGSWKVRRRFMFIVTFFCMYCILWVMHHGVDSRVNETIIEFAFLCIGAIVGSYVFGATWQDINFQAVKSKGKSDEHIEQHDQPDQPDTRRITS